MYNNMHPSGTANDYYGRTQGKGEQKKNKSKTHLSIHPITHIHFSHSRSDTQIGSIHPIYTTAMIVNWRLFSFGIFSEPNTNEQKKIEKEWSMA